MDDGLKKRLIGATVLVSLVVIFVPMLLEHEPVLEQEIEQSNIPPPPVGEFNSRIIPQRSEPPKITPRVAEPIVRGTDAVSNRPAPPPAATTEKPPVEAVATREGLSAWVVQVGSFSQRENAENLVERLRGKSFAVDMEQVSIKGKTLYRVMVGPEVDRKQAEMILARVNKEVAPLKLVGTLKSYP